MNNNNGFLEAIEEINTLLKVDQSVSMVALEEAANYFVGKLKSRIPVSNKNKTHLRDSLQVVVDEDIVSVIFGDEGWYWYLAEHGHRAGPTRKKVKGRHFVRNTFNVEKEKIENIMVNKIIKKMEG